MSDHAAAIRGLPRWHPNPLVADTLLRIHANGWSVTAVSDACDCCAADGTVPDAPEVTFAYTSGLVLHEIPELLVYGLDPYDAGSVLNELGELLHHNEWRSLVAAEVEITVRSLPAPVRLIEVIDKSDMNVSNLIFPDMPALQVIWRSPAGHFPWEESNAAASAHQPLKGVLPDGTGRIVGPRVVSYHAGGNRKDRRRRRRPSAG